MVFRLFFFAGNAPALGNCVFYGAGSPNGYISGATAWYHAGTSGWETVSQYNLDGGYTYIALRQAEHLRPVYTYDNNHTCTADGTKTVICANCGEEQTVPDEGSALGHSFTHYVSDDNYTCAVDGTETAKCDRCDATDRRIAEGSAAHRYIGGTAVLTEEYQLLCADFTGDGSVNVGDTAKLYAKVRTS